MKPVRFKIYLIVLFFQYFLFALYFDFVYTLKKRKSRHWTLLDWKFRFKRKDRKTSSWPIFIAVETWGSPRGPDPPRGTIKLRVKILRSLWRAASHWLLSSFHQFRSLYQPRSVLSDPGRKRWSPLHPPHIVTRVKPLSASTEQRNCFEFTPHNFSRPWHNPSIETLNHFNVQEVSIH